MIRAWLARFGGEPDGPCELDGQDVVGGSCVEDESGRRLTDENVDHRRVGSFVADVEGDGQVDEDVHRPLWEGVGAPGGTRTHDL